MSLKNKEFKEGNLAVYVMTHGPECTWLDDYCIPMELGAAKRDNLRYATRDDEGDDNISEKNEQYCELTGLYWMWKYDNHEYVGLYHYRRIFNLNSKQIRKLLSKYDIILPKKVKIDSASDLMYLRHRIPLDWRIMKDVLIELYPEYSESAKLIFSQNKLHAYNMFVTTERIFNDYCAWLFPILTEIERKFEHQYKERLVEFNKHKNKPGYLNGYYERAIGYLGESLIDVYVEHNKLKIREGQVCKIPPHFRLWAKAPNFIKNIIMSNIQIYNLTLEIQDIIHRLIHR